jgi:hypothetical protein
MDIAEAIEIRMAAKDQSELDQAYECLAKELPARVAGVIRWLRDPKARWIRIPVGVLFIIAGLMWFLPVVGIEFLPIGLLLIAQDVPFLRRPVGLLTLWLIRRWIALKCWWRGRRNGGEAGSKPT